MKSTFLILSFFFFSPAVFPQDSLKYNKKPDLGIEVSVATGFGYAYSFGSSVLLKKKHAIGLGITALLPINPFKEKWNPGAYLEYDFFFKKMNAKRMSAYISIVFQYLNHVSSEKNNFQSGTRYYESKRNSLFNLTGVGANFKLSNNLFFKSCISVWTVGYFTYSYTLKNLNTGYNNTEKFEHFDHNSPRFRLEELNLRCALSYYF